MAPDLSHDRSGRPPATIALAALILVLLAAGLATVVVRTTGSDTSELGARRPPPPVSEARPELPVPPPSAPREEPSLPHVPASQRPPLEELMAQVAEVRGLPWKGPLNLRVVPRDEMIARLRAANARDRDPAQLGAEEAMLKLLGLVPAGLDYGRLLDDLARSVVLGFYDPETKDLYVGVGDVNELNGAEKATIVHEMTHALTDQHFAYAPRTTALDEADKDEEYRALIALLEGDARLTEILWLERHLGEVEALAVLLGAGADTDAAVDVLARTPAYVQRSLFFPYRFGLDLVERLHSRGGFAAVDAAYRNPPTSTEHVLHPETYTAGDSSAPPSLPDLAARAGCTRVRAGTLGEFDMQALLEQHGGTDSAGAARGWNGDSYVLVRCGGTLAFADRWQSDPGTDAGRLVEALGRWSQAWSSGEGPDADGFFSGPSGAGRILRSGGRVDLVIARDAATAERLARALA